MDLIVQDLQFLDLDKIEARVQLELLEIIKPGSVITGVELPWCLSPKEETVQVVPAEKQQSGILRPEFPLKFSTGVSVLPSAVKQTEPTQISANAPVFVPTAATLSSMAKVQPFSGLQSNVQPFCPPFCPRPPFPQVSSNYPLPPPPPAPHGNYEENIHYQQPVSFRDQKSDEIIEKEKHKSYIHDRPINGRRKNDSKNYVDLPNEVLEVYRPEELQTDQDKLNIQALLPMQYHHLQPTSGYAFSPHQAQPHGTMWYIQPYALSHYSNFIGSGGTTASMNGEDMVARANVMVTHYEGQPLTMSHPYTSPAHISEQFTEEQYTPVDGSTYVNTKAHLYSPTVPSDQSSPVENGEAVLNESSVPCDLEKSEDCEKSESVEIEAPAATEEIESSVMYVAQVEEQNTSDNAVVSDVENQVADPVSKASLSVQPTTNAGWGSQQKSWADLFKGSKSEVIRPSNEGNTNCVENGHNGTLDELSDSDYQTEKLARFLQSYQLNFNTESVQPRGLINKSNWCYINATLQALLACPLFCNLLRQLPLGVIKAKSPNPVMNSLVHLIHEFVLLNSVHKAKKDELSFGTPLEPHCIHQMLVLIKSECIKGRQEDAEEFLSCILNGLHEEMIAVLKSLPDNSACNGTEVNGLSEDDSEGLDWRLMGRKGKGVVTRCSAQHSQSPITSIFGGQIRSLLTAGTETSATLQPFFTLQLDIQADGVDSVQDALTHFTVKEPIQGYTCPKTKKEVEANRRVTLEELPYVLILHFKRFVYDDQDGGSKKVLKKTEYPLDLEIKKELLSPDVRSKYNAKHLRNYRLFAVVYHDGKEAVKGHYIADVYQPDTGSWLRCDDRKINPTTEQQVLAYNSPCVPYLLFYGRLQQNQ